MAAFILLPPFLFLLGFITELVRQGQRLSLCALLNLVGLIIAVISIIPFIVAWTG